MDRFLGLDLNSAKGGASCSLETIGTDLDLDLLMQTRSILGNVLDIITLAGVSYPLQSQLLLNHLTVQKCVSLPFFFCLP
jgi:hypothetical protein